MANVFATHSVGSSLMKYLKNAYPKELHDKANLDFKVISSADLAQDDPPVDAITLLLYRITHNEHLRSRTIPADPGGVRPPLSLDLHYLLTAWASSASAEQAALTWAMREIQMHPLLDISSLSPEGGWGARDVVQFIPAELTSEELFRIWDLFKPDYRLTVSYIARVVRVDTEMETLRPVVATRIAVGGVDA
jgi:hypothetical protein